MPTYNLTGGEAEGLPVGGSVGWRRRGQGGGLKDHGAVWGVVLAAKDVGLLPAGSPTLRPPPPVGGPSSQ